MCTCVKALNNAHPQDKRVKKKLKETGNPTLITTPTALPVENTDGVNGGGETGIPTHHTYMQTRRMNVHTYRQFITCALECTLICMIVCIYHTYIYFSFPLCLRGVVMNLSGFEMGWEAEEIMGATEEQSQILFLIRW